MMKRLIIILLAVVLTASCTDNISSLNVNTKDPTEVSGESLFASSQKRLADLALTPNVNRNNGRLWVQHWQETTYLDESNYDQITRSIPDNHWTTIYRDILNNLKKASEIIEETDNDLTNALKPNKLAIIEIHTIYCYANLVETFGDVPYSEALDINKTLPVYDDALTVYKDLLSRLDSAIGSLDAGKGSFSGSEDLVYAGDAASWKKFANTLKMRMGMVLADVDAGLSKSTVESAYNSGVFESNADDAEYQYSASAPNDNPVHDNLVSSGRNDYVGAKTLIDMLNDLQDPRRAAYFDPNLNEKLGSVSNVSAGDEMVIEFDGGMSGTPVVGNNVYFDDGTDTPDVIGVVVSFDANSVTVANVHNTPSAGDKLICAVYIGGSIGTSSPYFEHTHMNREIIAPDYPGTILSYIETKFLLAEAAARGYGVGSAKTHYEEGIEASFDFWGVGGVADYLNKAEVQYDDANWKQLIATQAWIGEFNQTFAPYLSVRRLDWPQLVKPNNARTGYPVRYTYPVNEQNLNKANWSQASSSIGGDEPETRLFWDKNPHNWF